MSLIESLVGMILRPKLAQLHAELTQAKNSVDTEEREQFLLEHKLKLPHYDTWTFAINPFSHLVQTERAAAVQQIDDLRNSIILRDELQSEYNRCYNEYVQRKQTLVATLTLISNVVGILGVIWAIDYFEISLQVGLLSAIIVWLRPKENKNG